MISSVAADLKKRYEIYKNIGDCYVRMVDGHGLSGWNAGSKAGCFVKSRFSGR
jgi:hypothetical protein